MGFELVYTGHGVQGGWGAASDATPGAPLSSPSEFTHQVVLPRISDHTKKIDLQVCHSAEGRYPLAQIVANMTGIPTIGYEGEMRAMSNADKIFNSKLFFPEEGGKAKKTIEAAERQFMKKQNTSGNANIMSMMLMCLPCRFGNNQIEESDSNNAFQHGPVEGRRIRGSTSSDSLGIFSDAPSPSRGAARIDNLLNAGASGSESVQRERLRNAFLEIMNDQYGQLLVDEIEPAVLDERIRFNFLDNSLGNHMDVSDAGTHHAIVNINFQNDNVGQNSSALRNALRQALDITDGVDIVPKEDL
ncbi:hypothetical protein [Burkholderia singularis]|uniref:hypothetical protein n=1 Tax=Burkholderia singularis TaxID=1503053 RepID=UPI000F79C8B9|nr:hypothetical protein [Burkholderia singularis]